MRFYAILCKYSSFLIIYNTFTVENTGLLTIFRNNVIEWEIYFFVTLLHEPTTT